MFLFTVVHQQGELMKSQRAVGRHTEEGEELTGAWKTKGDTGGAGDPGMHLHKRMMKLHMFASEQRGFLLSLKSE